MVIFSNSREEHLKYMEIMLKRVNEAKLKIKLSKYKFAQKSIKYLDHMVGEVRKTLVEVKI